MLYAIDGHEIGDEMRVLKGIIYINILSPTERFFYSYQLLTIVRDPMVIV